MILTQQYIIKRLKIAKRFTSSNCIFTLWFLLICKIAVASPSLLSDDQKTLVPYYGTLEAIVNQSVDIQISTLQDFIKRFPEFERGYLRLLEHYILNEQIKEAKKFFTDLLVKKRYQRNSYWMLAKIYGLEKEPKAALEAYTKALSAGSTSPALLLDFLKFDKQYFGKFKDPAFMDKLKISMENLRIADILYSYRKLNYQNAIRQFAQLPKSVSHQLTMLYIWGNSHFRLVQYPQADSLWHIGLAISRKKKDLEFEAKFLLGLGLIPRSDQTLTRVNYFDSSYAIASRIGDLHNMEYLAGNRAIIYGAQGDFTIAEKLFLEVIQISNKLKSNWKLAVWYHRYGNLLLLMNRFDEALKSFDQCEEFATKSNNERMLIQTLHDKGKLYRMMGQNQLAKVSFKGAYDLAKKKYLVEIENRARVGLANIYSKEGKYHEARKIFKEAINSPVYKKGYARDRSYLFIKIGRTYLSENNYELAKQNFSQAYEQAKKVGAINNMIWSLIFLADIDVITNRLPEAAQKYNTCLEIALAKNDTGSTLPAIYLGLGNVYKKTGTLNNAILEYRKAADMIEKNRQKLKVEQFRMEYFVEASQVYNKLIDCYYQKYKEKHSPVFLDSLYYYVEMTRGRALRDLKLQQNLKIQSYVDNQPYAAYRRVVKQLKSKQRYLREHTWEVSSESEWNKILSEIEITRFSLLAQSLRLIKIDSTSGQTSNFPVHSLPTLMKDLKKRKIGLLLYRISQESSFVIAVSGEEVRLIPLQITGTALNSAITALISPFHNFQEKSMLETPFKAEIAYRLYRTLFKPVEDTLVLPSNLIIVPDIILMNLPFEMLLSEPPDKTEYTPKDRPTYAEHFLQHRYAIVYSPTTTILQNISKWIINQPDVLVFANPITKPHLQAQHSKSREILPTNSPNSNTPGFGDNITLRQLHFRTGWQMTPLPFAEVEANRIKEIAPSAKVYSQATATKASFLKEVDKYDIIHFATHGFVDTTYDAFSGLVLAIGSDSTDDGLLMGYEISELNLTGDLIILSACETGRGKLVTGEGVLGLPRLFLSAGAKSVLMTLWKVDDLFTSQLMPKFYDKYLNNKLSKSNALAEAKRIMLNKQTSVNGVYYQHPLFWASYTLYGDPGINRRSIWPIVILALVLAIVIILIRKVLLIHKKV